MYRLERRIWGQNDTFTSRNNAFVGPNNAFVGPNNIIVGPMTVCKAKVKEVRRDGLGPGAWIVMSKNAGPEPKSKPGIVAASTPLRTPKRGVKRSFDVTIG